MNSVARGEEETSRDDEVDVVKDVANEDEEASCDVKVVGSSFLQERILKVAMMARKTIQVVRNNVQDC